MGLIAKGRNTPTLPSSSVVDNLGPLLKGTLEEHLFLTLTLAGGGQAGVNTGQIIEVC